MIIDKIMFSVDAIVSRSSFAASVGPASRSYPIRFLCGVCELSK